MQTTQKFIVAVDMARFSHIQHHYETCFGMEGTHKLKNEILTILEKGLEEAGHDYKQALLNFEGDGAKFCFDDAARAHQAAVKILEIAEKRHTEKGRRENIHDSCRCFRAGIAYGDLTYDKNKAKEPTGRVITMATRLESSGKPEYGGCSGEIRICTDTYRLLPEDLRAQYGMEELVQGKEHDGKIPAHRLRVVPHAPWEPAPKKIAVREVRPSPVRLADCFVISPIDIHNQRIADVFEKLIEPACKQLGYRAQRADHIPGQDRLPIITGQLCSAPMAIAYLGEPTPNWNDDVMLEVGYRLSTGMPLVMLTDELPPPRKGESPISLKQILPFHLAQKNVLQVPKNPRQIIDILTAEMTTMRSGSTGKEWNTTHPVMEIRFSNAKEDLALTYISPEAKALFGLGDERHPDLKALQKKFEERMEPGHYKAYMKDRFEILARIRDHSMGFADWQGLDRIPIARIPLVFKDCQFDANNKPSGYLPVITRYLFAKGTMHLRLLYLEVQACVERHPDGYWFCKL